MRNVIVIIIIILLILSFTLMVKRKHILRQTGACLYERSKLLQKSQKDKNIFIPQCTLYGNYFAQQCYENMCWCVDKQGKKIKGTDTKGNQQPKACALNWVFHIYRRMQE